MRSLQCEKDKEHAKTIAVVQREKDRSGDEMRTALLLVSRVPVFLVTPWECQDRTNNAANFQKANKTCENDERAILHLVSGMPVSLMFTEFFALTSCEYQGDCLPEVFCHVDLDRKALSGRLPSWRLRSLWSAAMNAWISRCCQGDWIQDIYSNVCLDLSTRSNCVSFATVNHGQIFIECGTNEDDHLELYPTDETHDSSSNVVRTQMNYFIVGSSP